MPRGRHRMAHCLRSATPAREPRSRSGGSTSTRAPMLSGIRRQMAICVAATRDSSWHPDRGRPHLGHSSRVLIAERFNLSIGSEFNAVKGPRSHASPRGATVATRTRSGRKCLRNGDRESPAIERATTKADENTLNFMVFQRSPRWTIAMRSLANHDVASAW